MKKFNFRLEKILNYRHSLMEREKAAFGLKVQTLTKAEEDAWLLRGIRNETLIARLRAYQEGITAKEASNLHEHIVRIDETIDNADQKVEKAKREVDAARDELVERRRDERAVELLKARRFKGWLKEYYRDEGKTLDDIATIRHTRGSYEEE
jgi:flagellar protein FliJ